MSTVLRQTMPRMQVSLFWAYLVIPIGSALLLVFTVDHLVKTGSRRSPRRCW